MIGGLQGENGDLNNKYLKKKNLKESVANIWEHTDGFRSLEHVLRKIRKLKVSISQEKVNFATWLLWFHSLRNCLSAWCDCLPMAITSSFQLWFMHCLKIGLLTSQASKWHIVCIKSTPGSAGNVSYNCYYLGFLHVRFFSLFFLLAFLIWFWQRTTKLQSLDSSCKWASIFFAMDYTKISFILDCFGDQKAIKNTKT